MAFVGWEFFWSSLFGLVFGFGFREIELTEDVWAIMA